MEPLHVHYNNWIVVLSFVIAVIASYLALNLASKITRSTGKSRLVWLLAGSWVMGSGVWSMHFVGMLAFQINVNMDYDIWITVLSAIASMVASFIAFRVTLEPKADLWRLGIGGFFMGSGIVAMHYMGMAAIHTSALITYDPWLWALSALIALVTSYVALYLFRKFRFTPDFSRWKLLCSIVMGLAICGMHYTGMAASRFHEHGGAGVDATGAQTGTLLLTAVLLVTFLILAISWGAIYFDRNVLERMAYNDPLTGLPNRHGLARFYDQEFATAASGAILFVDLDRFKAINDTLGHDIGDLLLKEAALRLETCIGEMNTVFRLGGDEFLIAAPHADEDTAKEMATCMLQEIKKPYHIEGNELYITASIGISLSPRHGTDRSSLMKAADTAMYNSKGAGKNKFTLFDEEMDRSQVRKMGLERDLRKALKCREFMVYYQPKWDSKTNRMIGMEALLRWNHPELGIVSPAEFIPIMEDTGIIVSVTHWMLIEVCKQNQEWHRQQIAQVTVSVNMSVRVFESQLLRSMVNEALMLSGLEAQFLELEITESIAMNDVEDTVAQLQSIRELGVRVSLDDFGTGYSSLGTLDEMPVDILKIDQIFIRKSTNPSKRAIISNIIAIAQNLNLEVVAEGVETMEQIEFLQSRGCHVMQGYYYGKPMPASEISGWVIGKQP